MLSAYCVLWSWIVFGIIFYFLSATKFSVWIFGSSVSPGVEVGHSWSGNTSGHTNKWYFPCLKQSF
jgi:hypothetical protein